MNNWVILLIIINFFFGCVQSRCSDEETTKSRLKNELSCGYDLTERPVKDHKKPTTVSMMLLVKSLAYDMYDQGSLSINSYLIVSWKDDHLSWNPADHDGIEHLTVTTDTIWMPDISIYNRLDQSGTASVMDIHACDLASSGTVICIPPNKHNVFCVPDLTHFPFDEQECTMVLGSWVHNGEEVNLTFYNAKGYDITDFEDSGEWELLTLNATVDKGKYECCPNNTYPKISYDFHIKRHSMAHVAFTLMPAVVMLILTLITFCTGTNDVERTALICTNLLCHLLFAQQLAWLIPITGQKQPLLMVYTKNSLFLSTFTLVLTIIQRKLTRKSNQPAWITSLATTAANNKVVEILFFFDGDIKQLGRADDTREIIESSETKNDVNTNGWIIVAKILDRLCFIVYCILYLWMFIVLIP